MISFKVERRYLKPTYTIGNLYYKMDDGDWVFHNNTMEPPVGTNQKGEAIPTGQYKMSVVYSPKFKRMVPLILDVPNRDEIEWHVGDFPYDTEGCCLHGNNNIVGRLTESDDAFDDLMNNVILANKQNQYDVLYTQLNGQ